MLFEQTYLDELVREDQEYGLSSEEVEIRKNFRYKMTVVLNGLHWRHADLLMISGGLDYCLKELEKEHFLTAKINALTRLPYIANESLIRYLRTHYSTSQNQPWPPK